VLAVYAAIPPLRAPQPVAALPSVEDFVERVTVQDVVAAAPEDAVFAGHAVQAIRPGPTGEEIGAVVTRGALGVRGRGRAAISAAPGRGSRSSPAPPSKKSLPRPPKTRSTPARRTSGRVLRSHKGVASSTGSDDVGFIGPDDYVGARRAAHHGAGGGGSIGRACPQRPAATTEPWSPWSLRSGSLGPRAAGDEAADRRRRGHRNVPRRHRDACARRLTERPPAGGRPLEARGAVPEAAPRVRKSHLLRGRSLSGLCPRPV
jgi:hypothetical protein